MNNMEDINKIVGTFMGKDVKVNTFLPEKNAKITIGELEILIQQNEDNKVEVIIDNHEKQLTLVTVLGEVCDYRWY